MKIDFEMFKTMSDNDLKRVISHVKNLQNIREKDAMRAFADYDIEKVKNYLNNNNNNVSVKILQHNDFSLDKLNENVIELTELLKKTKNSTEVFYHKKLKFISLLIDNKEYLEKYINIYKKEIKMELLEKSSIPMDVMDILYKSDMLEIKHRKIDKRLLKIKSVFIYCIEKNLIDLDRHDSKIYYIKHIWNKEESEKCMEKHPELKDMTFKDFIIYSPNGEDINSLKNIGQGVQLLNLLNDETVIANAIKNLLKQNTNEYIKFVLENYKMDKEDLLNVIDIFYRSNPNHNNKFYLVYEQIKMNQPELKEAFKKICLKCKSGAFKNIASSFALSLDLEEKLSIPSKDKKLMKI